MKLRLRILLCLAALFAAWLFWPRGGVAPRAGSPDASATAAAKPLTKAAVMNLVATNATKLAAATNRLAFRLANTPRPLRELSADRHAILLDNAFIDTQAKIDLKIPSHLKAGAEPGAFLVQSRGAVDAGFRAAIAGAGGKIISYIPNNAFLVQMPASGAMVLAENPRVQAVLPYEPYYKVQSTLLGLAVEQKPLPAGTYLTLGLFGDGAAAIADAEKLGAQVLSRDRSPFGSLVRVKPPADWIALANLPGVQLVEPAYRRHAANDLSRVAVGVSTNTTDGATNNYLGLTGKNVTVEVNDTGIDPTHPDFTLTVGAGATRVTGDSAGSLWDSDGHGTHVAGIIAGNGTESFTVTNARGSVTNANFRGKAPAALLYSVGGIDGGNDTNFLTDDSYLQESPARTNALISNNSWGYGGDTVYDLAAASYDAAVRDALPEATGPQPVLFVFAAGNDGGGNDSGSGGVADSISSPGTAKNVVTVGALEELRNITNIVTALDGTSNAIWSAQTDSGFQTAWYSSRGNVGIQSEGDYGRFKPDVVAPGTFTISTRPGAAMWDQQKYYNRTNYHQTVVSDFVTPTTLAYGFITVPQNAVGVTIQVVPGSGSTNYPVYVSSTGVPDPADNTTYDFLKNNGYVSIPPDGGGGYLASILNGGIIYAVGDPSTNLSYSFNVIETVITTNDLGNQMEVMSNLNNTVGPYYRYESGTSMATPAVSGVLALMQDFFTNTLHTTPSPALLKALAINGARLTGSYQFAVTNSMNFEGWGLVKLPNSIPASLTNTTPGTNGVTSYFVDQSPTNTVATGDRRTWKINLASVAARQQPLRVTLAWTDPPGNPAAAIKLVNDLDLIVTNLDDPANPVVYYGNQFSGTGTPPYSAPANTNLAPDNVNNVENIFLAPSLGTNYSITVFGRAVNVNAVTLEQTNIVQDFALVIACGDGNNSSGFTVQSSSATLAVIAPDVNYLPATNGVYFNQSAGANAPWLSTNDVGFGANNSYNFYTNSVFHVGQTNQWHFYVVTNSFAVTNSSFTNAAFIVFDPNTIAIPREGVFAGSNANSTRPEADLELLVSTAPLANAGSLTNLDLGVISNCLFSVNGCGSAIDRGGTEFVAFTNSQPSQVYYIAVQCSDQMAGQFGFIPVFSDKPFSTQDTNGNVYVNSFNTPLNIPDGNNAHPGVGHVFGLAIQPVQINRVIVTNTFSHQNFGDLFGAVSHGGQFAVLNNHDGLGPVDATQLFVYDDTVNGLAGAMHSDGPGSLTNFRGKQGIGLWELTEVDNSYSQTGLVNSFQMKIEPHRDLRHQPFSVVTVPAGGWFYDYVDVPAGYTNLLVVATNITQPPTLTPPLQLFVKEGDLPTLADTNYSAMLDNGNPPGGSVSVGPPLAPDRYYVGIYNASGSDQTVLVGAILTFSSSAIVTVDFPSAGYPIDILDDAVTYDSIFVTTTNVVQNFNVGLRVDHQRISDLVFHLITPDGTRYLLMENRGGQTTNGCGMTILTTNIIDVTANGNALADTNIFNVNMTHGSFPITYNFYTAPDEMTVYYGTNVDPAYLIYDTGMTNNPPLGPGAQNTQPETFVVNFPPPGISADSTYLTIVMNQYGNTNRQTAWTYTAGGVLTNYTYLTFTEDTNLTQTPIKFAVPPFIAITETNITYATNYVYGTNFLFTTNITFVTNTSYATNSTFVATNVSLSTFETVSPGEFLAASTVDGWTVGNGQVSVAQDSNVAAGGSQFLALAGGSITRNLATLVGSTNTLTYAYRGPAIAGFWRGEGNVNDDIYGNNGTANGSGYTSGKVGIAFQFNYSFFGNYVNIPDTTPYVLTNTLSIDGWINLTGSAGGRSGIILWRGDCRAGYDPYFFQVNGDQTLGFHINDGQGSVGGNDANVNTTSPLALNQWYHVAAVFDNGTMSIYTNGVLAAQNTTSLRPFGQLISGLSPCIGLGNVGTPCWHDVALQGNLDEMSLYGRALSPSEIKSIYQLGSTGKFDTATGFPQNLAEASVAVGSYASSQINGQNLFWTTNTVTFVATNNSTPLTLTGLEPGILLDSFSLSTSFSSNSITTNIVITATTNIYVTVLNGVTNFASTFDTATAGNYTANTTVDGWMVLSNQVSVVNDPANAFSGSQFLALANGSISVNLPTTAGAPSVVMFNYRGPGIVGFWHGQGDTTDQVNGNNGAWTGGSSYSPGEVGFGFNFNGGNLIDLGNPPVLNPTAEMTIDYWINVPGPDSAGHWTQNVFTKDGDTASPDRQYKLIVGDSPTVAGAGDFRAHVWVSGGPVIVDSITTVQSNTWYHVAQTYDGTSLKLYVNGALDNQVAGSGLIVTTPVNLHFGQGPYGTGYAYPFNGMLDEPSIYNRALSDSEIKAIYQAGSNGKYDHSVSTPQNLAEARFTLAGQNVSTYYGNNTAWTSMAIPFTPAANSTAFQIDGLQPGMLIDSVQLVTAVPMATNYTTNIVMPSSNLCYQAEQDISGIQNINPYGEWKLEILDNRAGGGLTNKLISWQIEIQYANTNLVIPPIMPVLLADYSIVESNLLVITNTATYWNTNTTLTYTLAVSGVTNATISSNGIISWFPNEAQGPGSYIFVTTVRDPNIPQAVAQNFFQVDVLESNLPPAILFPTNNTVFRILETVPFLTNAIAYDPDIPTNTLTFAFAGTQNISGPPIDSSFIIDSNGVIFWQPAETNGPSTNIVFITCTDTNPPAVNQKSFTVTNYFTVVVLESNLPPVLTLPPNTNIVEMTQWVAQATATDPDWPTNQLTFALVSGPPGLTVSPSGLISWNPSELQGPGDYTVSVSVTDTNPWAVNQQSFTVTGSFAIHVDEWNIAPTLPSLPDTNIFELQTLTVTNTATDPDAPFNTLTYTLFIAPLDTNAPPVTNAFISVTGIITWMPTEVQGPGDYRFTTIVTDTNPPAINTTSFSATNSFVVHVLETNSAPFWTNGYPAVVMDELTVTNIFATAIDTDIPPNILTYTLATNTPPWVVINPTNGAITLSPGEPDGPSTNTITVIVTDNGVPPFSGTTNFTVVVNEVNTAPYWPTNVPGQTNYIIPALWTLVVTNTAADSDIPTNPLTYTVSVVSTNPLDPPVTNALIDTNGIFIWTPTEAQAPGVYVVTTIVTDTNPWALFNRSLSATNTFTVTVVPKNLAPFWTNSYPNVVMTALQITNVFGSATDTDLPPQVLTYSLTNSPAWAFINSSNGTITLSPGTNDAPTNVLITAVVTDNGAPPLSALTNFTVIVNAIMNTNLTNIVTFGGLGDYRGVGIKYWNGLVYLCGDSTLAGGLLADFSLPLFAGETPAWNTNWPSGSSQDLLNGITASANGIYSVGPNYTLTTDIVGGKEDKGLVVKYPFGGPVGSGFGGDIWNVQTPAPPGAFSYGGGEGLNAVTLANENGNNYVYTTGQGQSSGANGGRLFITKLNESGNILWTATDGAEQIGVQYSVGEALTVLNTNIYAAGVLNGAPYLRKYGPNGNLLWKANNNSVSGVYFGAASALNYVYAVGYANVSGTNTDFLVDKWDESGNLIWSRTFDRNTAQDQLNAAVNFNNRIFAVGYTYGQTAGGADAVVVEIDPLTGNLLSTNLFGGALDDKANGVDTDNTNLYVIGESRSYDYGTNQVMLFTFTPGLPALSSGQPFTNVVAPGGINWYQVNVPTNAIAATNALIFATMPVNFWFSTNVPPSITNLAKGDYEFAAATTGTTNVIYTSGNPLLVPGGTYYLGVQNPNAQPVTNAVQVTFELAVDLVNGVPVTNTVPANAISWHRVRVPSNADIATNNLLFATPGAVNLWFTTNRPPSITNLTDVRLLTNSTGGFAIIDTTNSPLLVPSSTYFLGVQNTNSFSVQFALKVTFHLVPQTFYISSIVQTNIGGTNGYYLTWFAPTNRQFHLQWTPLLLPATWKEMKGVISFDSYISATGSHFGFFDTGDTNRNSAPFGGQRYYRLHLLNSPTNTPPELTLKQTNYTANPLTLFTVTNSARDWDLPAQKLSYALFNSLGDTNAMIDTNGIITWTPVAAQSGLTNYLATIVSDDGVPVKHTTNILAVMIGVLPTFSAINVTNNTVNLQWLAPTNEQFNVRWTTNFVPPILWTLFPNTITSSNGIFNFTDTNAPLLMKFYQLILLP